MTAVQKFVYDIIHIGEIVLRKRTKTIENPKNIN